MAVLPADHSIEKEAVFRASQNAAEGLATGQPFDIEAAARDPRQSGRPTPPPHYGYLVPSSSVAGRSRPLGPPLQAFEENPPRLARAS
jgi:mannose-1-phosphate guanylyltransferase